MLDVSTTGWVFLALAALALIFTVIALLKLRATPPSAGPPATPARPEPTAEPPTGDTPKVE